MESIDDKISRLMSEREASGLEQITDRRDMEAEEQLQKYRISFDYELIDLCDINVELSKLNRGRINVENEESSEQYASAMLRGDRFPSICVRRQSDKKLVIAGGWHRFQAKLLVDKKVALAIVITCDDTMFHAISKRLNATLGDRPSSKDRVALAAQMVICDSWSAEDAARLNEVERQSVTDYLRRQEILARLLDRGIKESECAKLSDHKIKLLGKLDTCPTVQTEMAKLAVLGANIDTSADLKAKIVDVMDIPTEAGRLEKIAELMAETKNSNHRPASARRPKRIQFKRCLTSLESLIHNCNTKAKLQLDADDVQQLKKQWQVLSKKISNILGG